MFILNVVGGLLDASEKGIAAGAFAAEAAGAGDIPGAKRAKTIEALQNLRESFFQSTFKHAIQLVKGMDAIVEAATRG